MTPVLPGRIKWVMELVVVIAVLVAFDVAAWFLAVDSRPMSLLPSDRPARSI